MNGRRADESVTKDVHISHLSGPVRVLLPAVLVLITYSQIVRSSGVEVLGLWSLLSTVVSYMAILDVGFTSLLTRELASGLAQANPTRFMSWRRSAQAVYVIGGLTLAIALPMAVLLLGVTWVSPYTPHRMAFVVGALVLAALFQLLAKVELSVVKAYHQTYLEQWSLSIASACTYLVGLVGTIAHRPIEGLAIGACASNAGLLLWSSRTVRRRFPDLIVALNTAAERITYTAVRGLLRDGRHFFSLSFVMLVREPLFRLLLGIWLGPKGVGVYDLANRVPMLIREVGAGGAQAVFPSLARLASGRDLESALRVLRTTLFYMLAIGGSGLAFFAVNREVVFTMWLGHELPPGLVDAALLTTLWWGITLLNVPFYWLLQARAMEGELARAVWLHAGSLAVVVSVLGWLGGSLNALLGSWIATGLATQVYIYLIAERSGKFTSLLLFDRLVLAYLGAMSVAVWLGVHLVSRHCSALSTRENLFCALVWLAAYAVVCGPLLLLYRRGASLSPFWGGGRGR